MLFYQLTPVIQDFHKLNAVSENVKSVVDDFYDE